MAQNFLRGLLAISGASEVGGGGDMRSQGAFDFFFFFSVLFGWNQYVYPLPLKQFGPVDHMA